MKQSLALFLLLLISYPLANATWIATNEAGTSQEKPAINEAGIAQTKPTTDEDKKSFVKKHMRKLIALSIAGGLVIIPLLLLLLWYRNQSQSPSPSIGTTGATTPSHAPNKAPSGQKATEPQANGEVLENAENARKASAAAAHQKTTPLGKIYYEPDVEIQKKYFNELWEACKSDGDKRKELETNFYKTMVGTLSQDDIEKYYKNKISMPLQEAQDAFQKNHNHDVLTPFDKYEIALTLQTQETTTPEEIYKSVKESITSIEGGGHDYPAYDDLNTYPEFLAVIGEIQALIEKISKKEAYKNLETFELHQLGLWIRKNPHGPLNRTQRDKLYKTKLPIAQARKIVSQAIELQNTPAYQQTLEWLTLDKEVAQLALDMERYSLDNNQGPTALITLAESCSDKEKNVFRTDLFNKAFAKAKQALQTQKGTPAYNRWQADIERLQQRNQQNEPNSPSSGQPQPLSLGNPHNNNDINDEDDNDEDDEDNSDDEA